MNFYKTYEKRIIKQDLINKFQFQNSKKLTQLKKITLNFGCKSFQTQKFAATMLALELIASKKGMVTTAKNPNILLKIQKGQPAGCKVELRNEEICQFITKLSLEILPKLKHFSGFKLERQFSNLFFQMPGNKLMLKEFENQYPLFANLPALDVNIATNSRNSKKNLFLAKAIKLPVF
jgi:ribosomal protein L5